MAKSFLTPVIENLIQLLAEEGQSLKGELHRKVENLKCELEIIASFVKDAEARLDRGELNNVAVQIWVNQLREEANRIEDVIDEYRRRVVPRHHQSGFLSLLNKTGRFVKQLKARHGMAYEVQNIQMSLCTIKERGQGYGLMQLIAYPSEEGPSGKTDEQCNPPLKSGFIEEEEVVGIDSSREDLIRTLVDGLRMRTLISLVGTGGVGKTILAIQIYSNEVVKAHFECCAWITVSQFYNLEKLLKNLTEQIYTDAERINGETDTIKDSVNSLRLYLNRKRYLVIFDDVWDIDFWEVIKAVLPKNEEGSRIIITTRNANVAYNFCKETSCDLVHKVQPLSDNMAWKLFCKKAFQQESWSVFPKELEELSLIFIRKCQGLPLLITAIAGLLSTKKKENWEWQRVLANLSHEFENNPMFTSILKNLSLSYNDLPYDLKRCFLYFGIFPEDCPISDERLYRIWIAEGLVRPRRDETQEDTAKEYLEELICRNLVQVSYPEGHGYNRMCKVYNILRTIISLKADELGFFQLVDKKTSKIGRKCRRLSINRGVENIEEITEDAGVRSIFVFNIAELKKSSLITFFEKCELLTLLDFEHAPLEHLPNELGNLFHLKYLSLKNTQVKKLPKSVGKLQNLQTLDIRNTLLIELPIEINKLQNLQHLLAGGCNDKVSSNSTQGVRIKEGYGSLENLQTLTTVDARLSGIGLIRKLDKLRHLRRLGISRLTVEVASALCVCIEQMSHLESLSLHWANNHEVLDLQKISSPPPYLQCLVLKGLLQKLPDWFPRIQNLSMLCLSFSRLSNDPMEYLCRLPYLVSLWLYHAYDGEQLHFKEGGFPKLKLLVLRELHELKVMEIEEGALPCLEELRIGSSQHLNEVPSGVQHLRNLKVLANYDMPSKFVRSMQPGGGSNYWKVMHIPSVHFWHSVDGRSFVLYKLGEPELLDGLQGSASNIDDVAQREVRLSFSYNDDEEDFASTLNDLNRLSFCSSGVSVFSNDIVD